MSGRELVREFASSRRFQTHTGEDLIYIETSWAHKAGVKFCKLGSGRCVMNAPLIDNEQSACYLDFFIVLQVGVPFTTRCTSLKVLELTLAF